MWGPGDPQTTPATDASAEGMESTEATATAWKHVAAEPWSAKNEGQHVDKNISSGPKKSPGIWIALKTPNSELTIFKTVSD